MAAAAAAGNVDGCKLLLDRGCRCWLNAVRAAAREGHIPVLRLLMDRFYVPWTCEQSDVISEAAKGACMGGQSVTLAWLRRVHDYRPVVTDADAAARMGQVELLEQLLPELEPQLFPEDASDDGTATAGRQGLEGPAEVLPALPAQEYRLRAERLSLMCNILRSCPVEVAQRHFESLWVRGQSVAFSAGGADGNSSGGAAAASQTGDAYTAALAVWDAYRFGLLAAAVSSRTPCWPAKLDFLQAQFGLGAFGQLPRAWWGMAASLASAACWPREGCRQRLERLRGLGVQLDDLGVFCSLTEGGHVDALRYLWDECGIRPASLSDRQVCGSRTGEPAMLRFLHERGYRFRPERVAWEALHGASAETLLFLAEVVEDRGEDTDREAWSMAFRRAAVLGCELRVLQALRRRGADVNLAAVACGCGESHLDWAAAELRAVRRLVPLERKEAREVLEDYCNTAAMRWLQLNGLLPPVHQPQPRRRKLRCCVIS